MTFKLKLILSLLLLTVAPILITNYMGSQYTLTAIEHEKKDDVKSIVHSLAHSFGQYKKSTIKSLTNMSHSETIQDFFSKERDSQRDVELDSFLKFNLLSNDFLINYKVFDINTNLLHQVGYLEDTMNEQDIKLITEVMQTNKPALSMVYKNKKIECSVPFVILPIQYDGKIVGALTTRFNYKVIRNLFLNTILSSTSYPFIMTNNGLMSLHPDLSVNMKKNFFDMIELDSENLRILKNEKSGFVDYKYKSQDKLLYFVQNPTGQYKIAYSIPIADFTQYISEFKYIMIFTILILIILSIVFAIFIVHKVDGAMNEVKEAKLGLEEKNKELTLLSEKLAKFLSPQLYETLFSGRKEVIVETYRKKLTIFFSDIKDFSTITEDMPAEVLSNILNEYLNEMSKIALKNGGTIDKYIGDAIMVFFGDPQSKGEYEDAIACVTMAIEMRRKMDELQKTWVNKGISEPLKIRMGINTGYCTVGNFGSNERLDYTIIGGAVNMASRLESNARVDHILISHDTYSLIKDTINCEAQGKITVKGIAKPVTVYEVLNFHTKDKLNSIIKHDIDGFSLDLDVQQIEDKKTIIKMLKNTINILKKY